MRQRKIIYFLAHSLLVAAGAVVSLIGNTQPEPWKTILIAVGTSFIASGAAGMIIWVYLSQVEVNSQILENIAQSGLREIYPRRAAQIRNEYAVRLANASEKIDIMGFGLTDFRRDFLDQLGALSAKATVRIILLDPNSPYAAQRDKEEGQTADTIRREVEEFVSQYKQAYPGPHPRLELRTYTCLPLVNIFRIDNELFWGPYLAGKASGNTFTLRVARNGDMYNQLETHFEEVWKNYSIVVTT